MDDLHKYTDADIKSSYDPSDIVDAFRNMAKSSDNIEFVIQNIINKFNKNFSQPS